MPAGDPPKKKPTTPSYRKPEHKVLPDDPRPVLRPTTPRTPVTPTAPPPNKPGGPSTPPLRNKPDGPANPPPLPPRDKPDGPATPPPAPPRDPVTPPRRTPPPPADEKERLRQEWIKNSVLEQSHSANAIFQRLRSAAELGLRQTTSADRDAIATLRDIVNRSPRSEDDIALAKETVALLKESDHAAGRAVVAAFEGSRKLADRRALVKDAVGRGTGPAEARVWAHQIVSDIDRLLDAEFVLAPTAEMAVLLAARVAVLDEAARRLTASTVTAQEARQWFAEKERFRAEVDGALLRHDATRPGGPKKPTEDEAAIYN